MSILKHSFRHQVKLCLATHWGDVVDNQAMLDDSPEAIAARLAEAIAKTPGVTNSTLAAACDVSVQAVTGWLKTGKIARDKIVPAARHLRCTTDWLLTGAGSESAILDTEYDFIPRHRVGAAAGDGYVVHHEEVEDQLAFRRDWLRKRNLSPKSLRVIHAVGDSMADRIQDGDVLLVDTSQREIKDGKVYALSYDDAVRVKRLFTRFDGTLVLHSDNPNAKPRDEEVSPDKLEALAVRIIGRVVWSGGDL